MCTRWWVFSQEGQAVSYSQRSHLKHDFCAISFIMLIWRVTTQKFLRWFRPTCTVPFRNSWLLWVRSPSVFVSLQGKTSFVQFALSVDQCLENSNRESTNKPGEAFAEGSKKRRKRSRMRVEHETVKRNSLRERTKFFGHDELGDFSERPHGRREMRAICKLQGKEVLNFQKYPARAVQPLSRASHRRQL